MLARLTRRGSGRQRPRGVVRGLVRLALLGIVATVVPLLYLRWAPPVTTSFMAQRFVARLVAGDDPWIRYRWVNWREISPAMRLAVVASEDQRFPEHWGFDLKSIQDAAQDNGRRRRPRGASTITQQVAKNLFLWSGRDWVRKGLEAYLAVWIELLWPKRRILEMYLNVAEFGDGVYGVGGAADKFFRVPPRRIGRRDAAILAAVLPSPRRFRADRPSPYVQRRADWVERQMRLLGSDYLADLEPKREAKRVKR